MAYPGEGDLYIEDNRTGRAVALVWESDKGELIAELSISARHYVTIDLDRGQLQRLASHILIRLSLSKDAIDRILAAAEAA